MTDPTPVRFPPGRERITIAHAAQRALVVCPGGRTGRLVFVAPNGQSCRIELRPGVFRTARASDLELLDKPS
jgi:hypothetical protein